MRKLLCLLALCLSGGPALAQTDIFVKGSGRLFPIAVPQLCLQIGATSAAKDIARIIGRDLDLSGYFEVLDPGTFIETPGKCVGPQGFAYSDWSIIGAEGLVRGIVGYDGEQLSVKLYLHDVQRQVVVLGKEYQGDGGQAARIAHKFANEILRAFTGELGVFGTQIAYSSRVGRFKELFLMDMDGSNVRQLTNDRALSLASAWDPSGRLLVYTSYRQRMPQLFQLDVSRRQPIPITRAGPLALGAKFSRDGSRLLVSHTEGNTSEIVLMSLNGTIVRRLTGAGRTINVSPDWSPDESQIVFCSNRGGNPQIYTMNADGSNVRRISFATSNYCTSPRWSPKGDRIAFVCRADGGFQIFTANPDGSQALQLTSIGNNEEPDWSPDGRYLVFATTFGKGYATSLAMMRRDGSNIRQLTSSRIADSEPAWGPLID